MDDLLLSVFPGVDLLGMGFEREGFCVVRGPDLIFGGNVKNFHVPRGKFAGVIGGPPCQKFSLANPDRDPVAGMALLHEFGRIVHESGAPWFLMENVAAVPAITVAGYSVQRFTLNAAECGGRQHRNRCFHFGSRDGTVLVCDRRVTPGVELERTCCAIEGSHPTKKIFGRVTARRTWSDFCELQGLPRSFELPGMSVEARYRAVGNGVPVYMAAVIARAVRARVAAGSVRLCSCNCGRTITGAQRSATPACRKRLQMARRGVSVTELAAASAGGSRSGA